MINAKSAAAGDIPACKATRREFMAATTAAAVFNILSPGLVFGTEANSKITVGCVGLGRRGGWIANHLAQHPGYQITAVADYFEEVADKAGERLKVSKERRFSGLNGFQRLLDSKVDAVFLETPPFFFPQHARAAAEAGCHVFMAKPVAVDVPGCLSVLESGRAATVRKKVFLVDFQCRTDPFHIEAVKRVQAGMIGRIGLLNTYYNDECFEDPPRQKTIENLLQRTVWVNDTALGGAYIVNCDIHPVDVALWIAGDTPASAMGYSVRRRPNAQSDSHDCYAISYQFKNGMVMNDQSEHIRNSTGFKAGCLAYGDAGWLETQYGGKVAVRGLEDGYAGGESKNLYADGMMANVDEFHRRVTGGVIDNPTVEPSVNATLATILGREAGLKGRKITWDELLQDKTRLDLDLSGMKA